ncbi:hypothetical protein ScPMuIL_004291 [Solemya velum]
MDGRNLLYLSIICTCIIGSSVDAILPPHLRVKARLVKNKFKPPVQNAVRSAKGLPRNVSRVRQKIIQRTNT